MAKAFHVEVVTPEAVVWSGEATMLITRTSEGEMGVLADHEPLMGALATGTTEIVPLAGPRVTLAMQGGFLQVLANRVTLLTDRAVITEGGVDAARRVVAGMVPEEG